MHYIFHKIIFFFFYSKKNIYYVLLFSLIVHFKVIIHAFLNKVLGFRTIPSNMVTLLSVFIVSVCLWLVGDVSVHCVYVDSLVILTNE